MTYLYETSKGYLLINFIDDRPRILSKYEFEDSTIATTEALTIVKSKLPPHLKNFISVNQSYIKQLKVTDNKLKKALAAEFVIHIEYVETRPLIKISKLAQFFDVSHEDFMKSTLCLAHKLCNEKVEFNPELVDSIVINTIKMVDDVDRDINTQCMRVREWYGNHFPELNNLIEDNYKYLEGLSIIRNRKAFLENEKKLEEIRELLQLDEECLEKIVMAAKTSIGSEMDNLSIDEIVNTAKSIILTYNHRTDLSGYLSSRLKKLCPNLVTLVGENLAGKYLAAAGSMSALAKYCASTIQILGAERAFFNAVKENKNTPKYGLIYYASYVAKALIGQKGTVARMLASKIALVCKVDYFRGSDFDDKYGEMVKEQLEKRIEYLENKHKKRKSAGVKMKKHVFNNEAEYDTSKDVKKRKVKSE